MQNIVMYFANIWNAIVAFLASNAPMACLAIVAGAFIGIMIVLYISHLERTKGMLDSEEIGGLAQAMWEDYQEETALVVDTSIVGKDCPACGMFLEEGHVCLDEDEQIACRCGQLVRADRFHEHECPPDPAREMRALESSLTWNAYLRGELDATS